MARLTINLDDKVFQDFKQQLEQRLGDARPALRAIGMHMMFSIGKQFEAEGARFGKKWVPSRRALAEKGQTLQDKGKLRMSVVGGGQGEGAVYRLSQASLEIGSNLAYAAIHQFGGTIRQAARSDRLPRTFARVGGRMLFQGRDGRVKVGSKLDGSPIRRKFPAAASVRLTFRERVIKMPARPYLPTELIPEDEDEIRQIIQGYLLGDFA